MKTLHLLHQKLIFMTFLTG